MSAAPTLGALIVPARGGADLDAALAAASWADARASLTLEREEPATLETDWIVVLGEAERLTDAGARVIRRAVAATKDAPVFALPLVTVLLDMEVALGGRAIRVGPRGTPLAMQPGATFALAARGRRVAALDAPILRSRGATLSDAVDLAGAEAATFAALADERDAPARGILWHPLLAGLRALTAGAGGRRLGLGRWILAVFEGYRVVVAYAKLWERRRDRVTAST